MRELEVACAQVFKRKGKSRMPEKDFVFAVSLDFKWFTPKEAQKLLEICLDAGILALEGGMVVPKFDYKNVDAPKGYAPSQELLSQQPRPAAPAAKGTMLEVVEMVAKARKMEAKDVISLVNQTQDALGVEVDVAALIVAKNMGLDISGLIDKVEEELGEKCRK